MKIKKYNKFLKFILRNNIRGLTLAPFGIYVRDDEVLNNEKTINHEKIHWKQQCELFIIFFYILYIIEYLIRKMFQGKKAYINISFEKEAYVNANDKNYLKNRKWHSWIKYISEN